MHLFVRLTFIALLGSLFSSCGYNTMVSRQEDVDKQWANVEAVYQRRLDLIPNLMETVKGYAEHEKSLLTEVTALRSQVGQSKSTWDNKNAPVEERIKAANEMEGALSRLLVVVERYPDLKANVNFLEFQSQLEGTENRISVERRKYNEAVQSYNSYIRKVPMVLYSGALGFEKKGYFEAEKGAEKAPQVKF